MGIEFLATVVAEEPVSIEFLAVTIAELRKAFHDSLYQKTSIKGVEFSFGLKFTKP